MKVSTDLKVILPKHGDIETINAIQDYIRNKKYLEIEAGHKAIISNGISVIKLHKDSGAQNKEILEAHKKFYDIHYTIEGEDTIAYKDVKDCNSVVENYNEEGDYILYSEKSENLLEVNSGQFCIIPNSYAHAALYEDRGYVRKLVFKVPVS
ncbi:YhcH/YjgK/YiaL family protein [Autumnicola musiva]|uniref:YhcH/YjgK/YiaL family protein n=1 Tax=Autumnicola musiva TaxID=3075589 RepID=A0ABU3D7F0_9FLAO|nr:YhcH/YjgK/YiaL family protein [Zunongwangia sp. F117]MDT0677455.1 YhcH/YjgK/YiaL family protein [Zunongwangia sp. F117]